MFTLFLIALFIICATCQRSQFSTKTRHSRNGRVIYVNHFPAERIRSSRIKLHKNHVLGTVSQTISLYFIVEVKLLIHEKLLPENQIISQK